MATVRMYDDASMQERDVDVPEDVLADVLNTVFRDALWKLLIAGDVDIVVIERLRLRHKRWQQRMREAMATPKDPEDAFREAAALRAGGASWREAAAKTGVSVTTLRRRLEKAA